MKDKVNIVIKLEFEDKRVLYNSNSDTDLPCGVQLAYSSSSRYREPNLAPRFPEQLGV